MIPLADFPKSADIIKSSQILICSIVRTSSFPILNLPKNGHGVYPCICVCAGCGLAICVLREGEYQWVCYRINYIFKNPVLIAALMSSHQLDENEPAEVAGFIAKTFEILKNEEFNKIAYWAPSGVEFVIKDVNKFQQIVLPRYFRHNKINSFIRQLNMYGFHKSRADHSKSVFSHPLFLRDREDLLITIKRKIKGKLDREPTDVPETPLKRKPEEEAATAAKEMAETGNELSSIRNLQFGEANNTSFNIIATKERLHSIMNINFTVNHLPVDMGQAIFPQESDSEDDECVSIEHKITGEIENPENNKDCGISYKFMNPSCFFESMRRQSDI